MECTSGGECYKGKYCQCVACKKYKLSESTLLPCSVTPVAPCTKADFMDSVWELYLEWCEAEDVIRLPDFEEAFHFVKEHGLPD